MRSVKPRDFVDRGLVALILAVVIVNTGNLPAIFAWSVATGGYVLSILMLIFWRTLKR